MVTTDSSSACARKNRRVDPEIGNVVFGDGVTEMVHGRSGMAIWPSKNSHGGAGHQHRVLHARRPRRSQQAAACVRQRVRPAGPGQCRPPPQPGAGAADRVSPAPRSYAPRRRTSARLMITCSNPRSRAAQNAGGFFDQPGRSGPRAVSTSSTSCRGMRVAMDIRHYKYSSFMRLTIKRRGHFAKPWVTGCRPVASKAPARLQHQAPHVHRHAAVGLSSLGAITPAMVCARSRPCGSAPCRAQSAQSSAHRCRTAPPGRRRRCGSGIQSTPAGGRTLRIWSAPTPKWRSARKRYWSARRAKNGLRLVEHQSRPRLASW